MELNFSSLVPIVFEEAFKVLRETEIGNTLNNLEDNCRNCGAPHDGVKCGYCGTIYHNEFEKQLKADMEYVLKHG